MQGTLDHFYVPEPDSWCSTDKATDQVKYELCRYDLSL